MHQAANALEISNYRHSPHADASTCDHIATNDVCGAQPLLQTTQDCGSNVCCCVVGIHPLHMDQNHFVARWQDGFLLGPGPNSLDTEVPQWALWER